MPDLRYVKNIVERMKNMSHNLIVAANKDGRFTFKIDTNLIKLSTHFPNLSVQSVAGSYVVISLIFVFNCIFFQAVCCRMRRDPTTKTTLLRWK